MFESLIKLFSLTLYCSFPSVSSFFPLRLALILSSATVSRKLLYMYRYYVSEFYLLEKNNGFFYIVNRTDFCILNMKNTIIATSSQIIISRLRKARQFLIILPRSILTERRSPNYSRIIVLTRFYLK